MARTIEAVHTHTHTHTILLKTREILPIYYWLILIELALLSILKNYKERLYRKIYMVCPFLCY